MSKKKKIKHLSYNSYLRLGDLIRMHIKEDYSINNFIKILSCACKEVSLELRYIKFPQSYRLSILAEELDKAFDAIVEVDRNDAEEAKGMESDDADRNS